MTGWDSRYTGLIILVRISGTGRKDHLSPREVPEDLDRVNTSVSIDGSEKKVVSRYYGVGQLLLCSSFFFREIHHQ